MGKACHNHTMGQEEINRLLVEKSMEYEKTVRLKGGDVYVFGRGGEEGLFLHENGVRIEVVPGISSSTAGAAYAGIPVTHRGMARGFHVVTAHDKDDKLADTLSRLEIGDMIPPELYEVVAEILVFVDSMDKLKGKIKR